MSKVALRFGCAKQSKNLERCLNCASQSENFRIFVTPFTIFFDIFIGFQSYSPILPAFLIKNVGKDKMNFQILTVFLRMEVLKVTQVLEISTQNPIATVFRVSKIRS